jgi:hypothetical protein
MPGMPTATSSILFHPYGIPPLAPPARILDSALIAAAFGPAGMVEWTDETGEFISSLRPRTSRTMAIPIDPNEDRKVQLYLIEASKGLYPEARTVLARIQGASRRLVALRGYLRKGKGIRDQWTWTHGQIDRYKRSKEYRRAIADVGRVKEKFAELNPGYHLKVNVEVRTLDQQIGSWNATQSIAGAAQDLSISCRKLLADTTLYPEFPDKESASRFQGFLREAKLSRIPTLAVPGLSEHGQLRAFDFIIMKEDTIMAGTDAATVRAVWDNSGWTKKLNEAIKAVSHKFVGPLAVPYEPWHYSYKP